MSQIDKICKYVIPELVFALFMRRFVQSVTVSASEVVGHRAALFLHEVAAKTCNKAVTINRTCTAVCKEAQYCTTKL